jgi:membrane protein DedA with SNARE-associated domain
LISIDQIFGFLQEYSYVAMFGVLMFCGVGLPLPEEVPLIASGVAVGLKWCDFWLASAACVSAILVGDSIIYSAGRFLSQRFPRSWFIRKVNHEKVRRQFEKHGNKAVFFARFFAGLRIGVYAYAGNHGMPWLKFIFLDFLGAMISGPTSIWAGKFAVEKLLLDDPEASPREAARQAAANAAAIFHAYRWYIWGGLAVLAIVVVAVVAVRRRRAARRGGREESTVDSRQSREGESTVDRQQSTV